MSFLSEINLHTRIIAHSVGVVKEILRGDLSYDLTANDAAGDIGGADLGHGGCHSFDVEHGGDRGMEFYIRAFDADAAAHVAFGLEGEDEVTIPKLPLKLLVEGGKLGLEFRGGLLLVCSVTDKVHMYFLYC